MNTFYPSTQLTAFSMDDFKKEIMDKSFICELKDKTFFNCLVENVIPSQPDNLPAAIVVKIEGGQSKEIEILAIEKLTVID